MFSDANEKWISYKTKIEEAVSRYKPCSSEKCSCHYHLIKRDLSAFEDGIQKEAVQSARERYIFFSVMYDCIYAEETFIRLEFHGSGLHRKKWKQQDVWDFSTMSGRIGHKSSSHIVYYWEPDMSTRGIEGKLYCLWPRTNIVRQK